MADRHQSSRSGARQPTEATILSSRQAMNSSGQMRKKIRRHLLQTFWTSMRIAFRDPETPFRVLSFPLQNRSSGPGRLNAPARCCGFIGRRELSSGWKNYFRRSGAWNGGIRRDRSFPVPTCRGVRSAGAPAKTPGFQKWRTAPFHGAVQRRCLPVSFGNPPFAALLTVYAEGEKISTYSGRF